MAMVMSEQAKAVCLRLSSFVWNAVENWSPCRIHLADDADRLYIRQPLNCPEEWLKFGICEPVSIRGRVNSNPATCMVALIRNRKMPLTQDEVSTVHSMRSV